MGLIEDLIQQKKFSSEYEKLLVTLLFTSYRLSDHQQNFFKPFGISAQQYNVLRILKGQNNASLSINKIKDRMMDKNSDTSRLVSRLLKAGLVDKSIDNDDKRAASVVINKKGISLLTSIEKSLPDLFNPLEKLKKAEAKLLNELLEKVVKKLV